MSVQLSGAAESCLYFLHLNEFDKDAIRGVISRYSRPETFCETLSWIVYRIYNAIASLCGMSDWQKAQAIIQETARQYAIVERVIPREPLERNDELFRTAILSGLDDLASSVGRRLLESALGYHSAHADAVRMEDRSQLESLDLWELITTEFRGTVVQYAEIALRM